MGVITTELQRGLKELGLELNLRKCATFSSDADDNNECEIPRLEDCYRYLGLYQTERDTIHNITDVSRRAIEKAEEILQSGLTTRQKQELYNSTVVPTAVYVTGNLYPEEGVRSTLVRCREIDMAIRKLAVMHQIKTTTTSNQRFYLPRSVGGLAFRNIEVETAIQYVRRYWYLQTHPEMEETKTIYERLHEKGRRTPIGDYQHIRKKYKIGNHHGPDTPTQDICRREIEDIRTTDYDERCRDWAKSMNYPKLVLKYRDRISFPATGSAFLGSRKLSLINAAAEEQITALRPSQSYAEHLCRFGCGVNETAYHVSTSCRQHSYTSRHDNTAYWLLREILTATGAPADIVRQLQFGKATITVDYRGTSADVSIRAGVPITTAGNIKHNKPDIMVRLSGDRDAVYVFEVAVSHLQNVEVQERIKNYRYARNSMIDINNENVENTPRGLNLIEDLRQTYNCKCSLGVFVVGCYGEVVDSDAMRRVQSMMESLGSSEGAFKEVLRRAAYSCLTQTSCTLVRHINGQM